MKTFGNKLRELRTDNDLTIVKLSEIIKYSKSIISEWELDKKEPTATAIIAIALFFNVSTDYLLGLENINGVKLHKKKALNNKTYEFTYRDNENTFLKVKKTYLKE